MTTDLFLIREHVVLAELLQWPIADLKQVAKDLLDWESFPFSAFY